MSIEKRILDDQMDVRKQILMRRVAHLLEGTIQLQGVSVDTKTDEVMARFTDDSVRILAPLVEAVDILEAIIFASDGCVGHRNCAHSMEPWQRARALLQGKWESSERGGDWPAVGDRARERAYDQT